MVKHLLLSLLLIPALVYGSTPSATESRNLLLRQLATERMAREAHNRQLLAQQQALAIAQAPIVDNNASNNVVDAEESKQPLQAQEVDIEEQALMLMERANLYGFYGGGYPANYFKEVFQKSPVIAFLKATDAEDVDVIDKLFKENSVNVNQRDHRSLYSYILKKPDTYLRQYALSWLSLIQKIQDHRGEQEVFTSIKNEFDKHYNNNDWRSHDSTTGFTLLMKAAARGNRELAELPLLYYNADLNVGTKIEPWMVDYSATINVRALAQCLNRHQSKEITFPETTTSLSEALTYRYRYGFDSLTTGVTPLSLACIGGHTDIVSLFLEVMTKKAAAYEKLRDLIGGPANYLMNISCAIYATLDASDIADVDAAQELFKCMGLPAKPHHANYDQITHALMQALIKMADVSSPTIQEQLRYILEHAMYHGSCEQLQIVADALAQIPVDINWNECGDRGFDRCTKDLICGDKLAILLSIKAHTRSIVHQISRGMLARVARNPKLLANLQAFVAEQCYVEHKTAMSGADKDLQRSCQERIQHPECIPSDIARIIESYAMYPMSAEMMARILTMQPSDGRVTEALIETNNNNNT